MIPTPASPSVRVDRPQQVPAWAIPDASATTETEAAFSAGAALNCLDNLVRSDPAWAGAWRQRLALKCAAAVLPLIGRREDEAELRDAWLLRKPSADPGPAGNVLAAWRRLAVRAPGADLTTLRSTVAALGLSWSDDLGPLVDRLADARSGLPAPFAAAAILADVRRLRPDAALLSWRLADEAIALRMGWPQGVPLLATQARSNVFRLESGRGRVLPGEPGFERALCLALVDAVAGACRLTQPIAARAARLEAAAPKLRAKGAGEAIQRLLDDDAVSGTLATARLTRWGARRLFERLAALDAVQELSGRTTFRLYGL